MNGEARRWMGMEDVAEYTGIGYENVREWVSTGLLPVIHVPGRKNRKLIDRLDVDRLLESRKTIHKEPIEPEVEMKVVPKVVPKHYGTNRKKTVMGNTGTINLVNQAFMGSRR